MADIRIKRAYLPVSPDDGTRILVERLWPRELRKENAGIDYWLKEIAPTTELRKWFGHDPAKWEEFKNRYRRELQANPEAVADLHQWMKKGRVTLIYAARDEQHNGALALKDFLESPSSKRHSH